MKKERRKETIRRSLRFLRRAAGLCLAAVLTAAILPVQCIAANRRLSKDERARESYLPYTLGDIAAARFAVYGILSDEYRTPQKDTEKPLSRLDAAALLHAAFARREDPSGEIPFEDVDEDRREAVAWTYHNGIARGRSETEFGTYHPTEAAFATMLLNAMGYQGRFSYGDALDFAQSIGLNPVGVSPVFSLGDATLYLDAALRLTAPDGTAMRERMNVPVMEESGRKPTTFPNTVMLYPASLEDTEAQLEVATRYLATVVEIYPDNLPGGKTDLRAVRNLYLSEKARGGRAWYAPRLSDEESLFCELQREKVYEASLPEILNYNRAKEELNQRKEDGLLTDEEYETSVDNLLDVHFSPGYKVTLWLHYNEAWQLACDIQNDAFSFFEDDRVCREASLFYYRNVAGFKDEKDAVYRAKNAIVRQASYANSLRFETGNCVYTDEAHSLLGFFQNGEIVCDGYASVFQFCMQMAGIPCVSVFGSVTSKA
ncbi:MAG: transglutaminase domain-containing protein, partial [Abditibacteriota bacterium]|nr:transglutaminase domain-containing protein [Abditibacteriota bacterium]